jgi:hypothetical protein
LEVRALYSVPEAIVLLNLSRSQVYGLIRTRRLVTVTEGWRRLVPAESITNYVQLLLAECGAGGMATLRSRGGVGHQHVTIKGVNKFQRTSARLVPGPTEACRRREWIKRRPGQACGPPETTP